MPNQRLLVEEIVYPTSRPTRPPVHHPYFHNNSAATLEEVFRRYRHQLKSESPKQDLEDLLAFLGSL